MESVLSFNHFLYPGVRNLIPNPFSNINLTVFFNNANIFFKPFFEVKKLNNL